MMIPSQVTLIPQYLLFREFGWLNTHYPLFVRRFFGGAFGTFLLRQFFLSIPQDLEDAATIDGCSRFGIYMKIFLPLSKPALATLGIFVFMSHWNDLIGPLIYITSRNLMTLPLGLGIFRGMYRTELALLMAGSTITVTPMLLLYLVAQRYFVQTAVLSGLKF
jgi:ABC-type glycerol-3-phosphate transport system permease component